MNFFEQQDLARRQTRTLLFLFVLAVIAIVLAVNGVAALLWIWGQGGSLAGQNFYPKGFFTVNTLITVGLIVGGTLIETYNLRDGGDAVAKMAGGHLLSPATQDVAQRRLLNVVEEMALASGIACPKVYLLEREDAINAFAAGYNQNEAVIAVTRGALARLTRDELQGVVGHEFSHILNGDMRLNVRLIGVLFGIQMIAGFGQHLMDFGASSVGLRSRDNQGVSLRLLLLALGIALFVIGYIGIFFGRLIKSAVSRQREFLADASAVQFTRNPDGIGGALRKIGGLSRTIGLGSRIDHPNAEQLSHLFMSAARPNLLTGMFATHPPIQERVRRIYGRHANVLDAPEIEEAYSGSAETLPDIPYFAVGDAAVSSEKTDIDAAAMAFGQSTAQQVRLAPELDAALHEPVSACAVVYALLLGQGAERDAQLAILRKEAPQQTQFVLFLNTAIDKLSPNVRLPLLDLAMPALKQLPAFERSMLLATVDKLIAADNKITLAEFVLQSVLSRRLDMHAGRSTPVKFADLSALQDECTILLSMIAHVAASISAESPLDAFLRGAACCPQLNLSAGSLLDVTAIKFARVKFSLDRINQLAPLAKPALIKALLAAAGDVAIHHIAVADMLRAVCTALDAPIPPVVAATYADYWVSDNRVP